jgi:hypothetical protein
MPWRRLHEDLADVEALDLPPHQLEMRGACHHHGLAESGVAAANERLFEKRRGSKKGEKWFGHIGPAAGPEACSNSSAEYDGRNAV